MKVKFNLMLFFGIIALLGCKNPTDPTICSTYFNQAGDRLSLCFESNTYQWNDRTGILTEITDSIGPHNPYEQFFLFDADTVWIIFVDYEGESLAYVSRNGTSYITYKEEL